MLSPACSLIPSLNRKSPNWYMTEISAVSCTPLDPTKNFTSNVAAAFWHTNQVKILKFSQEGFTFVAQSPKLSAPVRSLLFYKFGTGNKSDDKDYHAFLLAGLADGSLVTMAWVNNELQDPKVISLGAAPVCLSSYEIQGKRTALAAGSRSVVISWDKSRLKYSPVTLKVCLNYFHFPIFHLTRISRTLSLFKHSTLNTTPLL